MALLIKKNKRSFMKHIITCLVLIFLGLCVTAQTPYEQLASKISQKMKDSLLLTEVQRQSIYQINLELHNQKSSVWQQYNGSDSLLRLNLQLIENKRDSLYMPVLTEEQQVLYKQKKKSLVNNN
jgi:hypothetical protein